ncbi:hypothetical protein GIB67_023727 [Kingdonia uniflora]|uniref:Uncharacterized protein n=1 Tax=Kingdonia uniflora TaxID=39325 RepID=A0A7J7MGN3_9MAGN|nr:hypothetical protein GIB67_023727 [Kingdonia uniflora]
MGRAPCCDKNGLKKGPWTPEEDQKLINYIQKHGHGSWRTLPKNAGLDRCGKSCRLRWTNYLCPDIKRGRFSFEEEETIIQLHSVLGNKWSAIAARLPGRTDNEIKNYWNTHIRKRFLRMGIDPVTHNPRVYLLDLSSLLNLSFYNTSQLNVSRLLGIQSVLNPELLRLAATLLSSQHQNFKYSFVQNLHENQHYYPQFQNLEQFSNFQPQVEELLGCPTSTTTCATSLNETHIMETNVDQFQSHLTSNFSCENSQSIMLQDNLVPDDLMGTFGHSSFIESLFENPDFLPNDNNDHFNLALVLSTPSSCSTPLNSSPTFLSSSATEDEPDTYCSNMLKFGIPDILEVNDFM